MEKSIPLLVKLSINVSVLFTLVEPKQKNNKSTLIFDKDLLQNILIEAKDIFINHQEKWEYIITNILNIYESVYLLEGSLDNKKNSITLMLEFFKKSLTSQSNYN